MRVAWITMLALANKHGEVLASIPGLADICRISIPEMEEALEKFRQPDPYSRTSDNEGRRIEDIDGGWFLLTHEKYRRMASKEEALEKNAARQARHRDKKVTHSNAPVTQDGDIAEAKAEVLILPYTSDAFGKAWGSWVKHRSEIKKKLTTEAKTQQLENLKKMGEERAIAAIQHSIASGWQGIFEPKNIGPQKPKKEVRGI